MGNTTITVQESTLERFKEAKAQLDEAQSGLPDHSADTFLDALLDTWERDGQAESATDTDLIEDALAQAGVSLTYDDVKNACESAIEEQFPEEMRV